MTKNWKESYFSWRDRKRLNQVKAGFSFAMKAHYFDGSSTLYLQMLVDESNAFETYTFFDSGVEAAISVINTGSLPETITKKETEDWLSSFK